MLQTRVSRTGIVIVTLLCFVGLIIVGGLGVCLWYSQSRRSNVYSVTANGRGATSKKQGSSTASSNREGIRALYDRTQANPLYHTASGSTLDEEAVFGEGAPEGETEAEKEVRLAGLVKALDAYAVEDVPQSFTGGVVSVGVLVLTAVYSGVVLYEYIHRDSSQSSDIFWTLGAGPFPAKMTCMALDGCYLSNYHETRWATAAAAAIDPAQLKCKVLAYNESYVYNITYSFNPMQGFSAVYDVTRTDPSLPPAFGLTVESVINCATCESGTAVLDGPVGPGTFLLNHVVTNNHTAISTEGEQRLEWFTTILSDEGTILGGAESTACYDVVRQNATLFTNMVQSRMRINSLFTVVEIVRPESILDVYGTIGGGYGLLLTGGSIVIMSVGMLATVYEHIKKRLNGNS